jgi:hypothetical protein
MRGFIIERGAMQKLIESVAYHGSHTAHRRMLPSATCGDERVGRQRWMHAFCHCLRCMYALRAICDLEKQTADEVHASMDRCHHDATPQQLQSGGCFMWSARQPGCSRVLSARHDQIMHTFTHWIP